VTEPVLILVGPPGSGKSTVGRQAAARLGVALEAQGDRAGALDAYRAYLSRGAAGPADRDAVLKKIQELEKAPR